MAWKGTVQTADGESFEIELPEFVELFYTGPQYCPGCNRKVRESELREPRPTGAFSENRSYLDPNNPLLPSYDKDDISPEYNGWHPPDRSKLARDIDPDINWYCPECGETTTGSRSKVLDIVTIEDGVANSELYAAKDAAVDWFEFRSLPFDEHVFEGVIKEARRTIIGFENRSFTVFVVATHYAQLMAWMYSRPDSLPTPVTHPPSEEDFAERTDRDGRPSAPNPTSDRDDDQITVRSLTSSATHSDFEADFVRMKFIRRALLEIKDMTDSADDEEKRRQRIKVKLRVLRELGMDADPAAIDARVKEELRALGDQDAPQEGSRSYPKSPYSRKDYS